MSYVCHGIAYFYLQMSSNYTLNDTVATYILLSGFLLVFHSSTFPSGCAIRFSVWREEQTATQVYPNALHTAARYAV